MRHFLFALCLGLSAVVVLDRASSAEPDDPFATSRSRPVRDAAFYAKQAKEEAEGWRKYLKFVAEPDLEILKGDKSLEIYRFTYQPCFHQHLFLTARMGGKKGDLEVRRFSEKGKLELSGALEIDEQAAAGIRREFYKPEIRDPLRQLSGTQRDLLLGLDGATWHLETLPNGKYTHAAVWSPDAFTSDAEAEKASFKKAHGFDQPDFSPFVNACLEFVKLSGLPLDAVYYEPMPRANR